MSILDCFRKYFGPLIGCNLEIDKNGFIKEIGNNPGATSSSSEYISHNLIIMRTSISCFTYEPNVSDGGFSAPDYTLIRVSNLY